MDDVRPGTEDRMQALKQKNDGIRLDLETQIDPALGQVPEAKRIVQTVIGFQDMRSGLGGLILQVTGEQVQFSDILESI